MNRVRKEGDGKESKGGEVKERRGKKKIESHYIMY